MLHRPQGYPPQGYPPQQPSPQPGYAYPPRPQSAGYQQVLQLSSTCNMPETDDAKRDPQRPVMAMDLLLQEGQSTVEDRVRTFPFGSLHILICSTGLPSVNSNAFVHGNPNAPPPPPQGPVGFGAGAPQGYAFQYSNCTGRRKALLIGINYFGQRGQLRGCINDVKNMSTYLNSNFGYAREDMVILTDDQQNPMSQPTKQNILRAMHWLVKDAKPNDSLFFHYSGKIPPA